MNLYLDIQGTLLQLSGKPAKHLGEFLKVATRDHTCFFVTSCAHQHTDSAHQQIVQNFPEELHPYLQQIKIAAWQTRKTDAIDFSQEFLWLDDQITPDEQAILERNDASAKAIRMDHFENPDQLREIAKQLSSKKAGFTLVEVLTVIVVIAFLSTLTILMVNKARASAKVTKAQSDIAEISKAIHTLRIDTEEWPGHQTPDTACTNLPLGCPANNELEDLNVGAAGLTATDGAYSNWDGPYMQRVPVDPWGNNYFFDSDYDIDDPSGVWRAVVGSYGPNGTGLNDYDSDDILQVLAQ